MDYVLAIVFGIIGLIIGILIPNASTKMIDLKLSKKGIVREKSFLDQKRYVTLIAIANGLLWAITGYGSQNILSAILMSCLISIAIIFSLIDLQIHIIPNELIVITLFIGIAFQLTTFGLKQLLLAALCAVIILVVFIGLGLIIGLNKIGAGDVKLAGVMGIVLGYPNILYGLMFMALVLVIYCIIGLSIGKLTHVSMFPFAPFLMFGMVAAMMIIIYPNLIGYVIS